MIRLFAGMLLALLVGFLLGSYIGWKLTKGDV